MTSVTCVCAWLFAVLMVPLMLFIWALDTKRTRINRYRSYSWSWKKIAATIRSALLSIENGPPPTCSRKEAQYELKALKNALVILIGK